MENPLYDQMPPDADLPPLDSLQMEAYEAGLLDVTTGEIQEKKTDLPENDRRIAQMDEPQY